MPKTQNPAPEVNAETPAKTMTPQEVQTAQAQARQMLLTSEQPEMPDLSLDIKALAESIRACESRKAELLTQLAGVEKELKAEQNKVDQMRQRYEEATRQTPAEANRAYLEGQKKERLQRFQEQLKIRGALANAGLDHVVDMDTVGLGLSPADRAIAMQSEARRLHQNALSRGKR